MDHMRISGIEPSSVILRKKALPMTGITRLTSDLSFGEAIIVNLLTTTNFFAFAQHSELPRRMITMVSMQISKH